MTDLFELYDPIPPRRRGWLRRLVADPHAEEARRGRLQRLGEVCAVLDDARAIVERGWVQGRWVAQERHDIPARACVVGAVVQATRQRQPGATVFQAGLAIDVLWDAWQETRGVAGPGVAGWAAPDELRAARVRDLARWNDETGRTHTEVLNLFDLATSRAIMVAMAEPAPR